MAKCMYMMVSSLFFSLPSFSSFLFFIRLCRFFISITKILHNSGAKCPHLFYVEPSNKVELCLFFFFFIINARGQDGSCIHVQNSVKWKTRSILSYDIGPLTNGF